MKKMLLLAVLSLFLISSCTKGKADFTIKGTIQDATFSAPLANASVKLYATEAGSTNVDQLASATLDAQGNFEFVVPRDKIETYYLEVTKDNYFQIYESIPFADLSVEDDNIYNLSTTAKGWVQFHINHPGGAAGDELEYARQEGKINCAECCPGGSQFFYGAVDSTFYCVNDGNAVYSGYYWASSGGSGPIWVETPPFDTVLVTITY